MNHQELSSRLVSLCFILWGVFVASVYADANTLPRHMVNVTAEGAVCRLMAPALQQTRATDTDDSRWIELAYDRSLLPQDASEQDIYTFRYDSTSREWLRLERVQVDTALQVIVSRINSALRNAQGGEYANAVISLPDLPQAAGFAPTVMADLPDPDPLEGIPMVQVNGLGSFGSPTGNNSGNAGLTYPITIPAGRHGLQPDVNLYYNSANGNGPLGVGWSLPMPAVTIDTRWGVPRYSPLMETEAYLVNGEPVVRHGQQGEAIPLPYQDSVFRPRSLQTERFWFRDTRNVTRVIRHGQLPSDYWWEVTTTDGVTYYYGRVFDPVHPQYDAIEENSVLRDADGNIGYWALTAVVDLHGNYVKYYNHNTKSDLPSHRDGDNIYIDSISYTGNCTTGVQPYYKVVFTWTDDDRKDAFSDGRLGLLRKTKRLLCHVGVCVNHSDWNNYYLKYTCNGSSMWKSRLSSVRKYDGHVGEIGYSCDYISILFADSDSVPGSLTEFAYHNAPSSSAMFGSAQQMYADSIDINKTISGGYSTGGTVTVGSGLNCALTSVSGGAHFTFGQSFGKQQSMLLDLNGDGLPDYVYEAAGHIYYRPQQLNNHFGNPVQVQGLDRLSHEVSRSYDWGVQLSAWFACVQYSNPITKSYTDYYYSDINADGLPDMVTPDGILFNHLTSAGHPSFLQSNPDGSLVPQNNSTCTESGIRYTGEVDARVECDDVVEVAVDSVPLCALPEDPGWTEPSFPGNELPGEGGNKYHPSDWHPLPITDNGAKEGTEILLDEPTYILTPETKNSKSKQQPKTKRALRDCVIPEGFYEDGYTYRVRGNYIVKFGVDVRCQKERLDPITETVRVWVAPSDGRITRLINAIQLIDDTTESRRMSRHADGIQYTIQFNRNNQPHHDQFISTQAHILRSDTIEADDYQLHADTANVSLPVSEGDILLFRLRSRDDNRYDNVHWSNQIRFVKQTSPHPIPPFQITNYHSEQDYVCRGTRYFVAPDTGRAIIRYKWQNNSGRNVALSFKGSSKPSVLLHNNDSSSNVFVAYDTIALLQGDSIVPVVSYVGPEPLWSALHIYPEIEYRSRFYNSDSTLLVPDTSFVYPDVPYPCSTIDIDSVYTILFGPLHKGWGRFAYNNPTNSNTLNLCLLINTERRAMPAAQQLSNDPTHSAMPPMSTQADIDALQVHDIDMLFANNGIFNPLDDNVSHWLPMYADSRTERWVTLGNLGYISQTGQSNSRDLTSTAEQSRAIESVAAFSEDFEEDITLYDSAIPASDDNQGRKDKRLWKSSTSNQNCISGGLAFINNSHSWGTYTVETDYMDMNGDGFPDPVGPSGVQYSTPWGGLGDLRAAGIQSHSSETEGRGINLSGTVALMKRLSGNNIKKSGFTMQGSGGGISENEGTNGTSRTFSDINGDGLPDIVTRTDATHAVVRYNLGYSFTDTMSLIFSAPVIGPLGAGESESLGANASIVPAWLYEVGKAKFAIEEYSIGGGLDASWANNFTSTSLQDINGDGLPDLLRKENNVLQVAYNTGDRFMSFVTVPLPSLQESHTWTIGANISFTCGMSFGGVVKLCTNPHADGNVSGSYSQTEIIDMDGDGLADYVSRGAHGEINVRYNQAQGVNLLRSVTNPTGHALDLEYTLSAPAVQHRQRQWLLNEVIDHDTASPWSARRHVQTKINYGSAYYDNHERTDYGYDAVTVTESYIRVTEETYHTESYFMRGYKRSDLLKDYNGNKYIGHRYVYVRHDSHGQPTDSPCDDANVRSVRDGFYTDYYEKAPAPQITTAVHLGYDNHHNIVSYQNDGDTAFWGDEWLRISYFLNTEYKNLVSLPVDCYLKDPYSNIIRHNRAAWTSYGQMKQMIVQDDASGMQALTSLLYDANGNLIRYRLPRNAHHERANDTIVYDNRAYAYPVRITNQFGETKQYGYDYRTGKPMVIVDPAGVYFEIAYDALGRLSKINAPREQTSGTYPAVTFRYHDIFHNLVTPYSDTLQYTWVEKQALSTYDLAPVVEASIYSARGELLQKKKRTEVFGNEEILTNGRQEVDPLGRIAYTWYPSISPTPVWIYDGLSNSTGANYTKTEYDVLDRDTVVTLPDLHTIVRNYDTQKDCNNVFRLRNRITDPNGNTTTILTAPQGYTVQTIQADNSKTCYDYNRLGELIWVIDDEGYQTYYEYDLFGRRTRRIHPDADTTSWFYDPAGNVIVSTTQKQKDVAEQTEYHYYFDRLMGVGYTQHPWDIVHYNYDVAGRLAYREDKTGSERLWYDKLGNVRKTQQRIILPLYNCAFRFETHFDYDTYGKIRRITYPDGEQVQYLYNTGGDLVEVSGYNTYAYKFKYNELGRLTNKSFCNGYNTLFTYDTQRQWLQTMETHGSCHLQELQYHYDPTGNIIQIKQNATPVYGLGGDYSQYYTYDSRNRLVQNNFTSSLFGNCLYNITYSPTGRMGNKMCLPGSALGAINLLYGYDEKGDTHQPRVIFDYDKNERQQLYWDNNGNLEQIQAEKCCLHYHLWDDDDRLLLAMNDTACGFYGYSGDGKRKYKLTGMTKYAAYKAAISAGVEFREAVIYPNAYITITPDGYTKHYFAGTERIATSIGGGGFCNMIYPLDELDKRETTIQQDILGHLASYQTAQHNEQTINATIMHNTVPEIQYIHSRLPLLNINVLLKPEVKMCDIMENFCHHNQDDEPFFYHPDHLGGAAWITDKNGYPVQYLHYAPYGELVANQRISSFDERFKFTGKERDAETGYDYFGARYYWSRYSIFESVDPLVDKFIDNTPFLYCDGNPINNVDPDGNISRSFLDWEKEGRGHQEASYRNEAYKGWEKRYDDDRLHFWFHGNENGSYILYLSGSQHQYDINNKEDLKKLVNVFETDPLIGMTWFGITTVNSGYFGTKQVVFHGCYTAELAEALANAYPGVYFTGATLINNTAVFYDNDGYGYFPVNTEIGVYKYLIPFGENWGFWKQEGEWRTYFVDPATKELQIKVHKGTSAPLIMEE